MYGHNVYLNFWYDLKGMKEVDDAIVLELGSDS